MKTDLTAVVILGSGLQTVAFLILSLLTSPLWQINLVLAVWATGELTCYGLLRSGWRRAALVHVYSGLNLVCLSIMALYSGGARSMSLIWLPLVIVFSSVVQGPKVGLFWALVASALLGVLALLHLEGLHVEAEALSPELDLMIFLTSLSGLAFLLLAISWLQAMMFNRVVSNLEQREEELTLASARAKVANEAKSQFLATVSHELRTPLNAITGYTELIQEDLLDGALDAQALGDDLERVLVSAKHLRSLIDDVLDISKIEAGGELVAQYTQVDLSALLLSVGQAAEQLAKAQGNTLVVEIPETPLMSWTDARRLRQIALNLLGNACKFTSQGTVSLIVSTREVAGVNGVALLVKDTGIGIPPEALEGIFEPFSQVDGSSTRAHGGTGLGLAITRQSVTLLGGTIHVESALGQGSQFTVWLPLLETRPDGVGAG